MAKSMSENIARILNVAPFEYGEDEAVDEKDEEQEVITDYQIESNDKDFERSKLRVQNADLLENIDRKYAGKISSRKRLRDSSDESEEDSENDLVHSIEEQDDSDDENSEGSNSGDENTEISNSASESEAETDFSHFKKTNVTDTVSKGFCVRNQLNIWESLLESRIQLQKCLSASNKLPIAENFKELNQNGGDEFKNKLAESRTSITNIMEKLLTLQTLVVHKFPETKKLFSEKLGESEEKLEGNENKLEGGDEEITSDEENLSESEEENIEHIVKKRRKNEEYEKIISKRHELYKTYRNSTIQKWNEKSRIGTLSKNTSNSHSILNQINHIMGDKAKLLKKTQLKRSNYKIIGEIENEEDEIYNENIYDDDDFYHQLLRELIEFKSSDITDPVQLGRQWIQLQNMRSKMKRKIDTRATKGRKLRYAVHSKLVNFMAPMDSRDSLTEEAKKEIFDSLFGKKEIRHK